MIDEKLYLQEIINCYEGYAVTVEAIVAYDEVYELEGCTKEQIDIHEIALFTETLRDELEELKLKYEEEQTHDEREVRFLL